MAGRNIMKLLVGRTAVTLLTEPGSDVVHTTVVTLMIEW